MNSESVIIRINGKTYTKEELLILIAGKKNIVHLPEWESDFFAFLEEWFSPNETIEAQTSGSTGTPQTIRLQKTTMQQSARRTINYFRLQAGNRLLLSLSCRFIAGKMMVVRAIVGEMDLISVDPASDFDFLLNETYDFGAMVPTQIYKAFESHSGKEKIENIRNLLIGGSAIPVNLETQISKLKSRVVSTYGMTETASHIAIRELSGEKHSDIYHCLPGISVSISENDCLQIHIPELKESLQTKDIAEVISPTSFRILGRIDDVIISGGVKYRPETIEKKIEQFIASRFVISSLPDKKLGEKLVLVIENEPIDTKFIQRTAIESLPLYERPKEICFLEQFPETTSGKLRRNEIKEAIRRF